MNKFSEIIILIFAWLCLVLALLCFGLSLYLLPYLFGWTYLDIPGFLLNLMPELLIAPTMTSIMEKLGIIIPFIIAGVVFIALSRYSSSLLKDKRSDDEIETSMLVSSKLEMSLLAEPKRREIKIATLTKILIGILLILALLAFAEYLLSVEFSLL